MTLLSAMTVVEPLSIGVDYTMDRYEIEIQAIFKTLVEMENEGVITHDQFLHYAKISEAEYLNIALTIAEEKKEHVRNGNEKVFQIERERYFMTVSTIGDHTLQMAVYDNHYGNGLYQEKKHFNNPEERKRIIDRWIREADKNVREVIRLS